MVRDFGALEEPTKEEFREAAEKHFLNLSEKDLELYVELATNRMNTYRKLDELSSAMHKQEFVDRNAGYRPDPEENPYNAYVTKCDVQGAEEGKLSEKTVGVKDNIAVAGVEMTAASKVVEGYVPRTDATAVSRLLAEGATITGKLNMDAMAWSGSGDLGFRGPIYNPAKPEYLAGGSSGGSAAAVVSGEVDIALGTDQAGSIRIPAALCGCVGLKPTYGLVPYTGAIGSGPTYDHLGPMASTVHDCALALEVMAGYDPADPRQQPVSGGEYVDALDDDPSGITIGVLEEGFGAEATDIDSTVRSSLQTFENAGATVTEVSIPYHEHGFTIWAGVAGEEGTAFARAERTGHFLKGRYDEQFVKYFSKARRAQADHFAPTVKLRLTHGQYLLDKFQGHYYAKAQNLRQELNSSYETALADVDVLAMPTTPIIPFEAKENLSQRELINRSHGLSVRGKNTTPFNMTGHPAISVPCGISDGFPAGCMFVGSHFDEETVMRAAHAFERAVRE